MKLTKDQLELLQVIQRTKAKMKINALINESLGEDLVALDDAINLSNLCSIFVNSFKEL